MKNMIYKGNDNKLKYLYRETVEGDVTFWYKDELSQFESIDWSDLSHHAKDKHGISKEEIEEFFYEARLKVVWRPDFKSKSGESTRVIGEHPIKGIMSVVVFNNLNSNFEIRPINAFRPGDADEEIWESAKSELAKLEAENPDLV